MKKILTTILAVILSLATLFSFTACNGNGKATTTMTNWGEIQSVGGMIAETENYIYFINGIGVSTDDNTFGTPLKGALMVADKSTLASEQVKVEVVVPKLFVSSDYGAGVYLFGEGANACVYYATPTLEKDSSGAIANSYLSFARTSLDGKKTDTFFTISGIDTNYRMGEKDGVVYIAYFDKEDNALKVFDTKTNESVVIAKQDAETKESATMADGKKAWLSLNGYRFVANGENINLLFTMTAYAENYYPEKAETQEYTRAEHVYNALYSYSFGDVKDENGVVGKIVADGSTDQVKYEFTLVEDGFLFYKETSITNKIKNYAVKLAEIDQGLTKKVKIDNETNVLALSIFNSLEEVYYKDSSGETPIIYKSTLVGDDSKVREQVMPNSSVSSLLFIKGDYIYYYNSSNNLARCNYKLADANEELISEDVVSTTWYDPEFVKVGEKEFIVYCDSSTAGSSYLKFVDVNSAVKEVEDKENEENNYFTLEGQKLLGVMTDVDKANPTIVAINDIASTSIEYEVVDGEVRFTSVREAREMYNALPEASKKAVNDVVLAKLENAETAEKLANYYYKLYNYEEYSNMNDTDKAEFARLFNEAKAYRQELVNKDQTAFSTIRDMIADDIKICYQEAKKLVEKAEA